MYRKLHSRRDPRDTLYSEIKKEFGEYFRKAASSTRSFTERYPKVLFGIMVFCIMMSVSVVFTLRRRPAPPPRITVSPVSAGLSRVLRLSAALKETMALKNEVDSISRKQTLDKSDSTILLKAMDKLQQINHAFIKKTKP